MRPSRLRSSRASALSRAWARSRFSTTSTPWRITRAIPAVAPRWSSCASGSLMPGSRDRSEYHEHAASLATSLAGLVRALDVGGGEGVRRAGHDQTISLVGRVDGLRADLRFELLALGGLELDEVDVVALH